jgi:hypothetical protein
VTAWRYGRCSWKNCEFLSAYQKNSISGASKGLAPASQPVFAPRSFEEKVKRQSLLPQVFISGKHLMSKPLF